MIKVEGTASLDNWAAGRSKEEKALLDRKRRSAYMYPYSSLDELGFELEVRMNTVQAARDLHRSRAGFASFEKSRCNERYWELTDEGGFRLRAGVSPSEAIRDIFSSGSKYAFECAAAIVIIMYKAVLDTIGEPSFDRHFADLYIWSWNYDQDLRLIQHRRGEAYAGDVRYFDNPDVDPETPHWQGENVIVMPEDDLYFGHGIGLTSGERIIEVLNKERKEGAGRSAYLLDDITHPDYVSLYRRTVATMSNPRAVYADPAEISVRLGTRTYLRMTHSPGA